MITFTTNLRTTKLTRDVGKFINNKSTLIRIFGSVKISRWALLVPYCGTNEIVAHAAKKTEEILAAKLRYVADTLQVCVCQQSDFSLADSQLINASQRGLQISVDSPTPEQITKWAEANQGSSSVLSEKLLRLPTLQNDRARSQFHSNVLDWYLKGQDILEALRFQSSCQIAGTLMVAAQRWSLAFRPILGDLSENFVNSMSITAVAIASLGSLASVAWLSIAIATIRHRKKSVWLVDQPDASHDHGLPDLAVLIAARNEAANIERTLKSILDQNYPNLTIIVVNDRSSDETGAIVQLLATQDARLRGIQVDALPVGWLGKTNALEFATRSTSATWLLFTDADVMFAPGTLRRAVAWSIAHDLDHLTVVPEFVTTTVGERIFLMLFGLAFAVRVFNGRVEAPGRSGHLGVGAFNLVRADALKRIGGFEHIRLSIDDDNRLAEALKASGGKAAALFGVGSVSVHWQVGLSGLVSGMEKNYFAILNYRIGLATVCCLAWSAIGVSPFLGLFIGSTLSRVTCAGGVSAIALLLAVARRQTGIGWHYVGLFPLCLIVHVYSLSRSTLLTLSKHGVSWRSNHYDLKDLRAHVRQRSAWLRRMTDDVSR